MNEDTSEQRYIYVPLSGNEAKTRIETMLEEAGVFAITNYEMAPGNSLYAVDDYLNRYAAGEPNVRALFDRNLFDPVLRAAGGEELRDNPIERLAMALMAFTGAARVDIEPSLALYEVAAKQGHAFAMEELESFRRAEALEPIAFQHLAFGDAPQIPRWVLQQSPAGHKDELPAGAFDRGLREWKRHRLALTKVALLARDQTGFDGMMELFRWSEEDAYFDGVAITLASTLLSPRSTGGVLSQFRSPHPERRVQGVENAAWDLTYVTEFTKRAEEDDALWVFCTADKRLAELTRAWLGMDGGLDDLLRRYWDSKDASRLVAEYNRAWERKRRPAVAADAGERVRELEDMQERLLTALEIR